MYTKKLKLLLIHETTNYLQQKVVYGIMEKFHFHLDEITEVKFLEIFPSLSTPISMDFN